MFLSNSLKLKITGGGREIIQDFRGIFYSKYRNQWRNDIGGEEEEDIGVESLSTSRPLLLLLLLFSGMKF